MRDRLRRRALKSAIESYRVPELVARDKDSLDIFRLKDDSLDNLDDLPPPEVLQRKILEHLEAALASFREVAAGLPRQAGNSEHLQG